MGRGEGRKQTEKQQEKPKVKQKKKQKEKQKESNNNVSLLHQASNKVAKPALSKSDDWNWEGVLSTVSFMLKSRQACRFFSERPATARAEAAMLAIC